MFPYLSETNPGLPQVGSVSSVSGMAAICSAICAACAAMTASGSYSSARAYASGSSDRIISPASTIAKILTVLFFMIRNLSFLRNFVNNRKLFDFLTNYIIP